MKWSNFSAALREITSVPFRWNNDKDVFFIKPGTRIFPVELCCERDPTRDTLWEMQQRGQLPYQHSPIELHMSQRRPVHTEIPWFMQTKHLHGISHDLWRYVDRTLRTANWVGQDFLFATLDEFDIQSVGIDIIVGFVFAEHDLMFLTDYHIEDGLGSIPREWARFSGFRNSQDRYEIRLDEFDRQLIPSMQHWISTI